MVVYRENILKRGAVIALDFAWNKKNRLTDDRRDSMKVLFLHRATFGEGFATGEGAKSNAIQGLLCGDFAMRSFAM